MKTMKFKRAMLVLTLMVMTLSAVTGGTIAWFTDSVSSDVNTIKSGNLDVELEYLNDAGTYSKVTADTKLFDEDALWEPGYTEVAYLKISNVGNLALKYQLGVNVSGETLGKTKTGADIALSDHLVFKAVETDGSTYSREEAMAAAGTVKGLKDYASDIKTLDAKGGTKDEAYVALIIYMPTTVGNEANHDGTNVPSITLGVNLEATQKDAESDAFGPEYDKDAWAPDMVVTSASELAAAIKNVEDGGMIALNSDLTFDEDSRTNSGGTWYEGLYYIGDKSFTIDLNGKTITNDSAVNDYLMLFKNNGNKPNTITFKNGTIEAGSSAFCAICTSTTSTQKITINLENVNLIGNNSNGAVAKIRGGAVLNVKDGTTITGKDSYVGIECYGATVNIYDGAEIYQNGTSSYVGSLVGVSGNGTVNVYGGKGKSAQGGFIAMTSGGTINVSGGEWTANTDGTCSNDNKGVLIAQSAGGAKSVVNVSGGTFKGGYNCYGDAVGDAQINISGGSFNANPASYVEENYKVMESNGIYTVAFDGTMVATEADLQAALNNGGKVVLNNDIALAETMTIPAGATVELILSGNTISSSISNNPAIMNNGTLTISGNGSIENTVSNAVKNTGTLTINGGDYVAGSYGINNAGGTLIVTDANVESGGGIYTWGGKVTVNGGAFSSNVSGRHAAYLGNAEVKLNGGTFHSEHGNNQVILASGANVEINGGTYSTDKGQNGVWTTTLVSTTSSSNVTINGGDFVGGGLLVNGGNLYVNGGTFNDSYSSNSLYYSGTAVVKGGTYKDANTSAFAKKYMAAGYEMVTNADGTWTVK